MAHFNFEQKILFQHCDPAGIVFYPRFFEMINGTVESWFEEDLDVSFSELHFERKAAIPTVTINTTFDAPSQLGDQLNIGLTVLKIGNSSLDLEMQATTKGENRFKTTLTLVHMDRKSGRPHPWPQDIRGIIETLLRETL